MESLLLKDKTPGSELLQLMLSGMATAEDVRTVVDYYYDRYEAGDLGNKLDTYVCIKACEQFFHKLAEAFKGGAIEATLTDKRRDVMGMHVNVRRPEGDRYYEDARWKELKEKLEEEQRALDIAKLKVDSIKESLKAIQKILDKEGCPYSTIWEPEPVITVKY